MEQSIRFCTTRDGVRIAYAVAGSGPVLVKATPNNEQQTGGRKPGEGPTNGQRAASATIR